jgi:tRNA(Ile)-lysidine synthase
MDMDLLTHIGAFVNAHGLVGADGVVAVSGGPDSVALAHALASHDAVSKTVLAHVNHRLRGAESDADEEFVTGLPADWFPNQPARLPCCVQRVDTAAEATRRGQNLEATARDLRYAWLAQVARETGATWVAVAHTADDQAETVLFRMLRGTGIEGLRGMSLRRPLDRSIDLVRPLLDVRRQDVLAYLEANALPYRLDSSNRDTTFTRNRIRRELIPQLEREYNPAFVDALCRLARQAADVQMEMRRLAEELLTQAELPRAGATLVLRTDVLNAALPHRLREMFRLVWQREKWPENAMGFDEWQRLVAVVNGDAKACDLPSGVRVRRTDRVVQLTRQRSEPEA